MIYLHLKVLFYFLMLSSFSIRFMFAVFYCAALCVINWLISLIASILW